MTSLTRPLLVICVLLLTAAETRAQIFTWNNTAGGTFGVGSNWLPAGLPPTTTSHTALFNLGATYTVSLGANHDVGTLITNATNFGLTLNMAGRTLNAQWRLDLTTNLTLTGGGTLTGTFNETMLRQAAILNIGTGTFFRPNNLNIGVGTLLAVTASTTATAATVQAQNATIGIGGTGAFNLNNASTGTFAIMVVGDSSNIGIGRVNVQSNSQLTVGTMNVGVQGTFTNNSRIEISGNSRVTLTGPLTVGGSTVTLGGIPPPLLFNYGGIVRLFGGATLSTATVPTLVNPGGYIDVQGGTFFANGNVNNVGRILNTATGSFIAPVTQITAIDGGFGGGGSTGFGALPGLECYGRMTVGTLVIGSATTSNGWAVLSTPSLTINQALIVGGAGSGRLDAGSVTVPGFVAGQALGSNGVVNVGTFSIPDLSGVSTFSSGTMSSTAANIIGAGGRGAMLIGGSSLFNTTASTTVGSENGSDGTLALFGSGTVTPARFAAPGQQLTIGNSGRGTLSISGNSSLNVGTLVIGPTGGPGLGTVVHSGGTVSSASPVQINQNGFYALSGGTLAVATQNAGTFAYTSGVLAQPVFNDGTVIINAPLALGNVFINNPTGRVLVPSQQLSGAGALQNAGSFGGALTVDAGMTLFNSGTISSSGGDLVIKPGVNFSNTAGSLIRNAPASTLRLQTFLENNGNIEVNAGGAIETGFSINVLSGQTLTMKGGLLAVGIEETLNLPIFPGARVVGFGQINASMYNGGSTQFNGPTQIVGLFQNDAAVNVRNATTIVYGPAINNGSITVNNGTIVFEPAFSLGAFGGSSGNVVGTGALTIQPGGRVVTDSIRQDEFALNGNIAGAAFGFIRAAAAGGNTSVVKSLTIAGAPGSYQSELDLADNAMVIDYDGAAPAAVRDYLASGYANGAWNGMGITSSAAAVMPNRALGFAEASGIFSSFPAIFSGESVDSTSLLIRYTVYGDANLDRAVNISDFALLAANFNQSSTWSRGDFNYDAITNITDFAMLAANFNQSLPADLPRQSIPEPVALASATFVTILLQNRNRR